jgi:hypothetical protein
MPAKHQYSVSMIKYVVACLSVLLHAPYIVAQNNQVAVRQPINSDTRITLWGLTLGTTLPRMPECATDRSLGNNAVCRLSATAHPPYNWVTINNAPYEHAHLSVILYNEAVESLGSVVEGPWCDPVLRSLQHELGQATVHQTERKQNSFGDTWRGFKWNWHTTRNTWVYYSMNLSEPGACVFTALVEIAKPAAVPAR